MSVPAYAAYAAQPALRGTPPRDDALRRHR